MKSFRFLFDSKFFCKGLCHILLLTIPIAKKECPEKFEIYFFSFCKYFEKFLKETQWAMTLIVNWFLDSLTIIWLEKDSKNTFLGTLKKFESN